MFFSHGLLHYGADRVGEDVLLHLLTGTSIFTPLPNGCLCQITGEYIFNLTQITLPPPPSLNAPAKRKGSRGEEESRPSKRRKFDDSGKSKKKYAPCSRYPFLPLILQQAQSRYHHFVPRSAFLCPPEPSTSHFRGFGLFAQKTYVSLCTSRHSPLSSRRRHPKSG